ncbi:MAG: hypothetical protein M3452_11705 [Chloroflexota bacterium]|nr:hypothetical protein [Chloroflexota bacterium]
MRTVLDLLFAVALVGILGACSTMGGATGTSPSPSPLAPTTAPSATVAVTPSAPPSSVERSPAPVANTPEEALTAVIAEYPRYESYPLLVVGDVDESPGPVVGDGLIGRSRWVIAREVAAGIELTFVTGSGDCPSGCIEHAYETYLVEPDGTVAFICAESDGPPGSPPGSTSRAVGDPPFEPCTDVPR